MVYKWYYAQAGIRTGPFSAQELRALATAGRIVPTDTVWREGTATGIPARNVQHLFAAVQVSVPQVVAPAPLSSPSPALPREPWTPFADAQEPDLGNITRLVPEEGEAELALVPELLPEEPAATVETAPAKKVPAAAPARPSQARKGRALAIKGAVIVSQDGTRVSYRKKCSVCGHDDGNRHAMPIRHGMIRSDYFCPQCRKNRPVQILGTLR